MNMIVTCFIKSPSGLNALINTGRNNSLILSCITQQTITR